MHAPSPLVNAVDKGSSRPLVTIVTPTRNRARLLEATMASVLSQGYPALEYIVVDDGSTDDTPEVLARYADRVTVVRQPNMGEVRAINRGYELARGDFIASLSDDDLFLPGAVRESVRALLEQPDLLAVYSDFAIIDGASRVCGHVRMPEFDCRRMLRRFAGWPGPCGFFRRDVLRLVGLRDPDFRFTHDAKFWLMIAVKGPMARLPMTLAAYRTHDDSTCVRGPEAVAQELVQLTDHVFAQPWMPSAYASHAREARSHMLAVAGAVAHRRSQRSAFVYYTRSLAASPMAWSRLPPRALLGRVARSLVPLGLLAPALEYRKHWLTARARRQIAVLPDAAAVPQLRS
jgi:glycosyltransferase involved in cell wall biosynthesis